MEMSRAPGVTRTRGSQRLGISGSVHLSYGGKRRKARVRYISKIDMSRPCMGSIHMRLFFVGIRLGHVFFKERGSVFFEAV